MDREREEREKYLKEQEIIKKKKREAEIKREN